MHYRVLGWHNGLPSHVPPKMVRAYFETSDGIVITATENFQWAVGKRVADVLAWAHSKRLYWAVADTREALDKRRGRKKYP